MKKSWKVFYVEHKKQDFFFSLINLFSMVLIGQDTAYQLVSISETKGTKSIHPKNKATTTTIQNGCETERLRNSVILN